MRSRLTAADGLRLPELFAGGYICINRTAVSADYMLSGVEQVSLSLPGHTEDRVDTGWRLLWQNHELLVVYKPPLLPVSRTTRNLYNTLISLVRRQTPYYDARLLHRLDTETSGLVVLAKDVAADRYWKPRLSELIRAKVYHAWVEGRPDWQEKLMECQLSGQSGSAIRSQVYVVDQDGGDYSKPRSSKTQFRLIRSDADRSLIECRLYTGRKHQIRAQLSYLGHPLVGDKIYAHHGRFYLKRIEQGLDENDFAQLGSGYHLLQAVELTLAIDGAMVTISLPEELRLLPAAVQPVHN
ncbi:RluA family pseudouridine synthase [Amphritea sp.]|uniref:RluA family pseudouridine synthase n=1 Tax=Amphritea sp. TaxID=1872502 RepID=UPI003D0E6E6A